MSQDSQIPWPKNQQAKYTVEKERKKTSTRDQHENIVEADGQEASTAFETEFEAKRLRMTPMLQSPTTPPSLTMLQATVAMGQAGPYAPSSSGGSSLPDGMTMIAQPSAEEVRGKVVVQHIRKAHNAWDKGRREFTGTIDRSKEHENTKGCKFEG